MSRRIGFLDAAALVASCTQAPAPVVAPPAPAPTPAAAPAAAPAGGGGRGNAGGGALSEDARSQVRGQLVTLRGELRAATGKAGDRETKAHLENAEHRISEALDPKK